MSVTSSTFGYLPTNEKVLQFTLRNKYGLTAKIINYGATLTELWTPDKNGQFTNIVLGYTNIENYLKHSPYFGATIGRFANRIAKGQFTLNGITYQLATNSEPNHLHGGPTGIAKQLWQAAPFKSLENSIEFFCFSPDGEEGYPGDMTIRVKFELTNNDELKINYRATTSSNSIINLTNHAYFNLKGKDKILDHQLWLNSDYITPTDAANIPTGKLMMVTKTPFDFRTLTPIGQRINADHPQLEYGNGYDHNWVIKGWGNSLQTAAKLYESTTGRSLEVATTEPGIQVYTANTLSDIPTDNPTIFFPDHGAVCLETQHYPDSPNHSNFPTTVLKAGEVFESETVYKMFNE